MCAVQKLQVKQQPIEACQRTRFFFCQYIANKSQIASLLLNSLYFVTLFLYESHSHPM